MKRILNHLLNPVVVIMIILFVIFTFKGCTTIEPLQESVEIESIPEKQPVDPVTRDKAIIKVWECMFVPGSCSESTQ